MRIWTRWTMALVVCLAARPVGWAQVPAIPGGAVPPLPGAPPLTPPTVAAPNNLWSFLCPSPAQCASLKARFCASPFGQITSAMGGPMSFMSGGLFGNCCPANGLNPADLLQDPSSGAGAAALVKADAAGAAARRAAIRYLGTVDCRYWPEAEAALINGLRADKIECVRWEAAMALQRHCCCTTKVILALTICVAGADNDGNPAECSPRVRDNAAIALSMCVADVPGADLLEAPLGAPVELLPQPTPKINPEKLPPPEKLPKIVPTSAKTVARQVKDAQRKQVVALARRILSEYYHRPIAQIAPGATPPTNRPGANGLLGIVADAFGTGETAAPPVGTAAKVAEMTPEPQRSGLVFMAYSWMRNGTPGTPSFGPSVGSGYQPAVTTVQYSPFTVGTSEAYNARLPVGPATLGTPLPPSATPTAPRVTTGYIEWDR